MNIFSKFFGRKQSEEGGNTQLILACMSGDSALANLLVIKGADVNYSDEEGETPLMKASFVGNNEIVGILLSKGANIDAQNNHGATALMIACINGNKETVKLLIEKGSKVNYINKYGTTALMMASASERGDANLDIVEFLLAEGAEVNSTQKNGMTPLMWASWNDSINIAKALITNGADVTAKAAKGATAVSLAIGSERRKDVKIIQFLQSNGADLNAELEIAKKEGETKAIQVLQEVLETIPKS